MKIDEIIADDISGVPLSDEDTKLLNEWMSTDENAHFVDRLAELKEEKEKRRIVSQNLASRYQSAKQILHMKRRSRRLPYYSIAAGIALVIGVGTFFYTSTNKTIQPKGEEQIIRPGKPYAELWVSGGRTISLEANRDTTIILEDGRNITLSQNTLLYDSTLADTTQNILKVPRGAEYNLELADGSKIFINSASEVRYPTSFYGTTREVYLTGEAFFDIAKNSDCPFIVHTSDFSVHVTGTSFNIRSYPRQNEKSATLVEGAVEIICNDKDYVLTPGTHFAYHLEEKNATVEKVNVEAHTSWKDGYYYFYQSPLGEIMETLALWYNFEVDYDDSELKEITFFGRFKRYDEISYLLDKFGETGDIGYEINDNKITIKRKK